MRAVSKALFAAGMLAASFAGGVASHWIAGGDPALAAPAQAAPKEVRTQAVIIVDANGKERARLGIASDTRLPGASADSNLAGLLVNDEAGVARVAIVASTKTGAGLTIQGADGKDRIGIGADGETAGIGLNAADGTERISLGASNDGKNAGLEATGGKGKISIGMGVGTQGGGLSLKDGNGRERAGIGMPPNAGAGFTAHDETGKEIWRAP